MQATKTPAFRRKVFYIPGFDPFPPRRYRELYRREGAAQAALSGYVLSVQGAPGEGGAGWQVAGRFGGLATEAQIDVLVWSDLVQAAMDRGIVGAWALLPRTAWTYVASGALRRLARLRKGPVLAALYPVAMLLAQAGVALAAGLLIGRHAAGLHPAAGWAAGLAAAAAVLLALKRLDRRLYAYYLLYDYAYTASAGGAYPAALAARIGTFAARIRQALAEPWDEVLVVGHSSGAQIAVSALAEALAAAPVPRPPLALLTLGQAIPMVSFLPRAQRLRADLHALAQRRDITWVDVSAPGDGCSFALCDPVAVSGVAPPGKRWPLVLSAAFTRTLAPATRQRLRWRFFRLHFQYLCAFDALPGERWDYDYFRLTAGPRTLAAHFGGRPASRQTIRDNLTPHDSMAA
jgi:hypothetical protein